jgi:hypothetical protein
MDFLTLHCMMDNSYEGSCSHLMSCKYMMDNSYERSCSHLMSCKYINWYAKVILKYWYFDNTRFFFREINTI